MTTTYAGLSYSDLHQRAANILDAADKENRELTPSEVAEFDQLEAAMHERVPRQQSRMAAVREAFDASISNASRRPGLATPHGPPGRVHSLPRSSFAYFDKKSSAWVHDIGADKSINHCSVHQPEDDGAGFGELLAGMLTGDWTGRMAEQAAVTGSSDTAGGVLLPVAVSNRLIDLARANSVMMAAGARTITLPAASEFRIAKVTTDPTAYWRTEGGAITSSQPVFDAIIMRPKTLGVLIPITIELLEDVQNLGSALENVTARAIALAIDQAVLRGSVGSGAQPLGIRYTTDVQTSSLSSAAWSLDDLVDARKLVWDQNGPAKPSAVILSSAAEGRRQKTKDGNGQYLTQPQLFDDVPFLVTTSIPDNLGSGSNESEIFVGDFTTALIGVRTQLTVEMLNAGTGTDSSSVTFNATSQLGRWLRVYTRVDCHIEQPKHVCVLTDLLP